MLVFGYELAPVPLGKRCDGSAKQSQIHVGFLDSSQGQVGAVLSSLTRNPDPLQGLLRVGRQFPQCLAAFDSDPEDPWPVRVGKPAKAMQSNGDRPTRSHRGQRGLHFLQSVFRPLPDELRGNVQISDLRPTDGRVRTQPRNQSLQPVRERFGQIDGCEQAHT